MKKDRSSEEAILTAKMCLDLEIEQLIHMIVGGPGETIDTVRFSLDKLETIDNYRGNTS